MGMWTKDAEREQLRKIAEMIEETEQGSYIRMAFAGCVRMAEENIEYDFANSYPELLEFKDKQIEEIIMENSKKEKEVAERLRKLEHENNVYEQKIEELENRISTFNHLCESKDHEIAEWKQKFDEAVKLADEWETNAVDMSDRLDEKDAEIVRLKAENMNKTHSSIRFEVTKVGDTPVW